MLTSFDTASNDASVSSSLATIFRGKLCDTLLRNRSTIDLGGHLPLPLGCVRSSQSAVLRRYDSSAHPSVAKTCAPARSSCRPLGRDRRLSDSGRDLPDDGCEPGKSLRRSHSPSESRRGGILAGWSSSSGYKSPQEMPGVSQHGRRLSHWSALHPMLRE